MSVIILSHCILNIFKRDITNLLTPIANLLTPGTNLLTPRTNPVQSSISQVCMHSLSTSTINADPWYYAVRLEAMNVYMYYQTEYMNVQPVSHFCSGDLHSRHISLLDFISNHFSIMRNIITAAIAVRPYHDDDIVYIYIYI